MGVSGERGEATVGFLLSADLLGSPWDAGSKDCILNSSFGTNPGKSSKSLGDLQAQEVSGPPQGRGPDGQSHPLRQGCSWPGPLHTTASDKEE